MSDSERSGEFESVKTRLAEIAEAVDDESLSLDSALDLYEEAVALGLKASDLLESNIVVPEKVENQPHEEGEVPANPHGSETVPADGGPSPVAAGTSEAETSDQA